MFHVSRGSAALIEIANSTIKLATMESAKKIFFFIKKAPPKIKYYIPIITTFIPKNNTKFDIYSCSIGLPHFSHMKNPPRQRSWGMVALIATYVKIAKYLYGCV